MPNKLALAGILAVASALGAFGAWSVKSCGHQQIAVAEAFAGGALLSAGLLHLLADSSEDWGKDATGESYPWPYLLCLLGCVSTHFLEAVAETLWRTSNNITADSKQDGHDFSPQVFGSVTDAELDDQIVDGSPHAGSVAVADAGSRVRRAVSVAATTVAGKGYDMVPVSSISSADDVQKSLLAGPLLMLALSVHSILEGLSLGASDESRALEIFLAIFAHKGVAAFALGTAWLSAGRGRTHRSYLLAMSWFTFMTPLGILFGRSVEGHPAAVVVTALSAGTFLYIGLVEGCPGVRSPWLAGLGAGMQAIAFSSGLAAMAILAAWT